jgi:hypothetical protein
MGEVRKQEITNAAWFFDFSKNHQFQVVDLVESFPTTYRTPPAHVESGSIPDF